MNKQTEALKMAIEAMENSIVYCEDLHHAKKDQHKYTEPCPVEQRWNTTIQACKEALEQPAQEPVYTNTNHGFLMKDRNFYNKGNGYIWDENFDYDASLYVSGDFAEGEKDKYTQMIVDALNTHPAPSWQGLSDDEKSDVYNSLYNVYESDNVGIGDFILIYDAIEQALKEKNT